MEQVNDSILSVSSEKFGAVNDRQKHTSYIDRLLY